MTLEWQGYADIKDDRLEAGPFSLGGGSPVLSFWHHFTTENNYDGGVLEMSTDGSLVSLVTALLAGFELATLCGPDSLAI